MLVCKCGHQNSDGSKFCSECGQALTKVCHHCKTENSADSKFCFSCGKSLSVDREPERDYETADMHGGIHAGDVHNNYYYYSKEKETAQSTPHTSNPDAVCCQKCNKEIPISSKAKLQCSVCGMYYCADHIDLTTHMCDDCIEKALTAFEFRKYGNGKYAITKIKDKNTSSITIPPCVEVIDDGAFEGCSALSVTFPNGLLKIGDRAFANCTELSTVVFPQSMKSIGKEAFLGCSKLDHYFVPSNITQGENAFMGTKQSTRNNGAVPNGGFSEWMSRLRTQNPFGFVLLIGGLALLAYFILTALLDL